MSERDLSDHPSAAWREAHAEQDRARAIQQIKARLGAAYSSLRPAELEEEIAALLHKPRR